MVKLESPEMAEQAWWMMNGRKPSGPVTDVQIDRNALLVAFLKHQYPTSELVFFLATI